MPAGGRGVRFDFIHLKSENCRHRHALQNVEPRAIYLHSPDSSDLKALREKNHFCKLRFFWMDHLFPIA